MSTYGSSLRHIFDSTIPENTSSSSLIETLSSSWKQIRPVKPPLDHSFTEIFGELHFKESTDPFYSSASPWQPPTKSASEGYQGSSSYHKKSDSFSSLNSESLQLCTEGLGSESLDYVEDLKIEFPGTWLNHNKTEDDCNDNINSSSSNNNKNDDYHAENNSSFIMREKVNYRGYSSDQYRKRRSNGKTLLPPPISCIGKTGKPGVCFQSYRQDGRFVLEEVKIPTYERLQASREDGRLRLCFIPPSDQDDDDGTGAVVDEDNGGEDEGGKIGVVTQL